MCFEWACKAIGMEIRVELAQGESVSGILVEVTDGEGVVLLLCSGATTFIPGVSIGSIILPEAFSTIIKSIS